MINSKGEGGEKVIRWGGILSDEIFECSSLSTFKLVECEEGSTKCRVCGVELHRIFKRRECNIVFDLSF